MPPSQSTANIMAARRGNSVSVVTKSTTNDVITQRGGAGHTDACQVLGIIRQAEKRYKGIDTADSCDCFKAIPTSNNSVLSPSEKTNFTSPTKRALIG